MAKTSSTSLTTSVQGHGLQELYSLAPMISNQASPGAGPLDYALLGAFNSIVVPPGAVGVIIKPPTGSVVTKLLKGITGDRGFAISANSPTVLSFPPGATVMGLTLSAPETVSLHWL